MRASNYLPFLLVLMEVENGNKVGYDKDKDIWFAHESVEGGLPTIGYGHKVTEEEEESGQIKIDNMSFSWKHGLSNLSILKLFQQDVKEAEKKLSNEWHMGGLAKGQVFSDATDPSFSKLPAKHQGVLLSIAYNVGSMLNEKGLWAWPKLRQAILANDDRRVFEEMLTWYKDKKGRKVALRKRREKIAEALGVHKGV
jgi:GH24 family phage-related lysozyme (muramidase)